MDFAYYLCNFNKKVFLYLNLKSFDSKFYKKSGKLIPNSYKKTY